MSAENNQGSSSGNERNTPAVNVSIQNMRHILGISTSLTDTNSQTSRRALTDSSSQTTRRPIDPQQLKFFFEAIDNITGVRALYDNEIQVIKNSLEELRTHPDDVDRCSAALDNIMVLIDHFDIAKDFIKMEGFSTVGQFLNSENEEIIRLAAEIIGIATQNHPLCQETVLLDKTIFPKLIQLISSSKYGDNVKQKAVFAISSMIQNNKAALDEFIKCNGYEMFLHILKSSSLPLQLRTCFVIDCLCHQFPQIKSTLLEKDYISCLVDLLTKIPLNDSKETVLNALLSLVEDCYDAVKECRKPEYNLIATIDYLIIHYSDNHEEEKQKAIRLKVKLNRFTQASG